jgi:16S rRNA (cytosine967-C5)-methyltransferase
VGVRPGEQVLDACSGHGNKSWLLAQQASPGGAVDASDLHPAKLDKLLAGPPGKRVRATFAIDWTVGAGDVPEGYDRVIVDAPCSGTGTLRRRPEIGRKREAEDLAGLADLQTAITRQAATRVRDGGTLLYAVCSVLKEEAEDVVARLVADAPGSPVTLSPLPFESDLLRTLAGEGHTLRLLPHVHGTDGYFVASLRVTKRG